MQAYKKIDEFTALEAFMSYDDYQHPQQDQTYDRMFIYYGGSIHQTVHEGNAHLLETEENVKMGLKMGDIICKKYTYLDPQTRMPMVVIKIPMKSYWAYYYRNQFKIYEELKATGQDNWEEQLIIAGFRK